MHRLNWDDLRLLLAVARAGRLSGAARDLRLDHTTVARRLSALEQAAGCLLVDRTPKGTRLTSAGQTLLVHAERVEHEILAAGAALGDGDARISGTVRLATPEAFGTWLVAPNIWRLYELHPDLSLELTPESQTVHLANREADLAITLNRPPRGPIVARSLVDYRIGLFASHDYLAKHGPIERAEDLIDLPFASYIDGRLDMPELHYLNEAVPGARRIFHSTSVAAQHEAVAAGMGLGLLHVFAAKADPRLVQVLPKEIGVTRTYWLAAHEDQRRLPRVQAVITFLDALIGQLRANL